MPEAKLLKSFSCPNCGESKTVTEEACDKLIEEGRLPVGTPSSLRKAITPLISPQTATLTVPVIIVHYDICSKCGVEYSPRVETMDAPIQMAPIKGNTPPFFGR